PEDIVFGAGTVGVAGVPERSLSWASLVAAAGDRESLPEGMEPGLAGEADFAGDGRIINPLLAEGQIHGGIAQGIGQALFEEVAFDDEGTPRTASLLDYVIPSAGEIPDVVTATTETPSPNNPLGAKGIGESGTIG